jgi:hypothetical protein
MSVLKWEFSMSGRLWDQPCANGQQQFCLTEWLTSYKISFIRSWKEHRYQRKVEFIFIL